MTNEEYLRLKREADRHRREHDREEGARDQALSQIQGEFGCKTLKQAESLLERKRAELGRLELAADKEYNAFILEHGDALGISAD